jgi:hypothetical protein
MVMDCQKLVNEGKIQPATCSQVDIKNLLSAADSDMTMAESLMAQNLHVAYSVSYHACMKICCAYMKARGYKPANSRAHEHILEFMKATVGDMCAHHVEFFEAMCSKYDQAVYENADIISDTEVEELLNKSKEFAHIIKNRLQKDFFGQAPNPA